VSRSSQASSSSAPPTASGAALRPIVCIDDDPDDLFFITRRISRSGARNPVLTFSDGDLAVNYFTTACEGTPVVPPACVVFCDIKMPRMSGFETLQWFRDNPLLASIPFVMLSGSNEPIDREKATLLGANGYLVKFPTEAQLAEIISRANAAAAAAK
jgi:CheY-like chemotaxis protein